MLFVPQIISTAAVQLEFKLIFFFSVAAQTVANYGFNQTLKYLMSDAQNVHNQQRTSAWPKVIGMRCIQTMKKCGEFFPLLYGKKKKKNKVKKPKANTKKTKKQCNKKTLKQD